MEAIAVFEKFRTAMTGMTLSEFWRGYGSAIFLEFGELTPNGKRRDGSERHPLGEFTVGIEWSWRIENASSIVCGSWSDEEHWQPAFDLLRNRILSGLTSYARLPELDIEFDNQHHLLSFNTTDEQPDWFIIDRRKPQDVTLMVENGALTIETPK